jgi:hypothetical protein
MADGRKELPVPAAIALPLQWANIWRNAGRAQT